MERQASNPTRSRIWFHHTFGHSLAECRRGLAEGYLRILDLLVGDSRLDLLDKALQSTQRCTVTVVPLHGLAGSANRRFMYNRHSRLL